MKHHQNCRWENTKSSECEYRETHHYCPHAEHACNCKELESGTKKEYENFYEILRYEGFSNWTIKTSGAGSYCWIEKKRIDLTIEDLVDFLHELAHALVKNQPHGDTHNREWGDHFAKLVRKYMEPINKVINRGSPKWGKFL